MGMINLPCRQFYISLDETCLYERDWNAPKYMQRAWWQTATTMHTGLRVLTLLKRESPVPECPLRQQSAHFLAWLLRNDPAMTSHFEADDFEGHGTDLVNYRHRCSGLEATKLARFMSLSQHSCCVIIAWCTCARVCRYAYVDRTQIITHCC